jgi:hypothetical protein
MMICVLCLAGQAQAQIAVAEPKVSANEQTSAQVKTSKQKQAKTAKQTNAKQSKKQASAKEQLDNQIKSSISKAKGAKVRPTSNLNPGSVGYYFYPMTPGSYWKMRTVKSLYDHENKLVASDTMFHRETVTTNSAPSMQGLPLIKCQSKSFRPGQLEDSAVAQEVTYYVDDSLIMAVFNNSVSHNENVALLTSPLREGYVWPERFEDTIGTMVMSLHEPVETPAGKFDNAVVTSTRLGFGELSKYFVGGKGIVKMVFNGVASNGQGRILVTTDLMEIHHEISEMEGSPNEEKPSLGSGDPVNAK